jgi:hypothetical protein
MDDREFQKLLGLPLPSTAPRAAFNEGLERLQELQRCDPQDFDKQVEQFRAWAMSVHANFE